MSEQTRKFIAALGEDPETLKRFRADPKAIMEEFNVPEVHQQLILADDKDGLKKEAGLDDAEVRLIIM